MKLTFVLGLLLMSALSAKAGTACSYTETPCDEHGNHYYCYSGNGWAGDREFCSAQDLSTPRPTVNFQKDFFRECLESCVNEGGAPSTCHHKCW